MWPNHPALMLMENQNDGTENRRDRKYPSTPGRDQNPADSLPFYCPKCQQQDGKNLVLQYFAIILQCFQPVAVTKRPALPKRRLEQDKESGHHQEKSRDVMVSFTFVFVC